MARAWSHAVLVVAALLCDATYIEVPAVVQVPQAATPEFVELPKEHPVWEGAPNTLGVLLGDDETWERTMQGSGFQLVVGVAHNAFRDPTQMQSNSFSLFDDEGLYLGVKSSLSSTVYKKSLAGALHPSQPRPFHATGSTTGCPGDVMCRISIVFPAIPDFDLSRGDEFVTVWFGPRLLAEGVSKTSEFRFVIRNDEEKDGTVRFVSDALEIVVASSLLFGSSQTAAVSSARQLLLLNMKCGETHNALDHATNPAEWELGDRDNRYYTGGLVVNLMLGFIPVVVHLVMVLIQWKCSALPQKKEPSPHQTLITADELPEARCFGMTITEFRQLQASVRYPHYSSLFLLFAFQGVATCSWRLIIHGQDTSERIFGACALLFFNFGGMFFAWWKLGKGEPLRMGAVYVKTAEDTEWWKIYLLGTGEWVSSTRRRLVHCYGILFECYREGCTRFVLTELAFMLFFSLMGTLDAEGWNTCLIEFGVTALGAALFLVVCWWKKPWASQLDNHTNCTITGLQVLGLLLHIGSFLAKDVAGVPALMAEYLYLGITGLLILKCIVDVVLLVWDTCAGRRWRLQETFEQGQTLFQGRHCFRKNLDDKEDPDDMEGEEALQHLAPRASSAFVDHVLPPTEEQCVADEDHLHDPFDHTPGCLIDDGVLLLSRRGAKREFCPCCHNGKVKGPDSPLSDTTDKWSFRQFRKQKQNGGRESPVASVSQQPGGVVSAPVRDGIRVRIQQNPVSQSGTSSGFRPVPDPVKRSTDPDSRTGVASSPMGHSQSERGPSRQRRRQPTMQSTPISVFGAWHEYRTPEGLSYYHNASSNTTSWSPPLEMLDRTEP
eukprot:TRINITY_DN32354_c0_g1_i2.p1 TRINITY_DN32354_c0_g1~~TRINITY_DN32354_c0_g1_i2.p1  ORF type:complete len:833 (+),score=143.37 TRINITY_DN32354_c0_g1_i2:1490-3988(+)